MSPQTLVGFYTIPFSASLFIGTTLASSKSACNYNESEFMKPNLQTFKKFPSFGYVTSPSMNLTVPVIPAISFDEQFREFWSV